MLRTKKILKELVVLSLMCYLFTQSIISEAAVAGYAYSFSLQAGGQGAPGISGSATKQTNFSYAQVNVNSYSNSGYYTRAFTTGAIRSYERSIANTGSYSVSYPTNSSGNYHYGGNFNLNMMTSSNNPYAEKVSGNWTP